MDLPRNTFKHAIKAGQRQIGIWCSVPDPVTIELLAGCGYDWITLDTEHSPTEVINMLPLLQAVAPYPVSPVVRPSWNDPVQVKKALDIGAQTILIPYVQNADEAKLAVDSVRYPPRGIRGVAGTTRATRFGAIKDYHKRAEEELCLLVQTETVEAVDQIEEIAKVDGVDGIFIGPADLAASMGYAGQPSHPEVVKLICDGIRRIRAAGKAAGFLSGDQAVLEQVADAGATFLSVDIDLSILRRGALARRDKWR